jgi:hypothetical protein
MVHSPQFFCCRYARLVLNLSAEPEDLHLADIQPRLRLSANGRFCCKTILLIRARKIDSRTEVAAQR